MRKNENWHRRIATPNHGDKAKLAKDCNVNPRTVYEALRGIRDTESTRLVRTRAMKYYHGYYVN